MRGYVYDERIGGYRDRETGRKVATKTVLNMVQLNNNYAKQNISEITDKFFDGRLTLPQWQDAIKAEIKQEWLVAMMAGRGGKDQMTQADYGRLGGRLSYEYRKLADFAIEIKSGNLSEAQIRARIALYADGARTGFWDGLQAAQTAAGKTEERRILGEAEHCQSCMAYAAMGWQPLGSLPSPGTQCECLHNCKCTKEYK